MPVRPNGMTPQLYDGQPGFGGLRRTPKPAMVEVLSSAGYDHVVLDPEHDAQRYEAFSRLTPAISHRLGMPTRTARYQALAKYRQGRACGDCLLTPR
jgi:2-keto-3-deoxy-L-rhamnonate aldolase RhmA